MTTRQRTSTNPSTPNNTTNPTSQPTQQQQQRSNRSNQNQQTTTTSSSSNRNKSTPIDPEAIPLLESLLDESPRQDNGRESELNEMYSNQIFHAASRYKGPKISNGYEELVSSQHPLQVVYPDKFNSTGLAYSATSLAMKETHNPTLEIKKRKFCCCFPIPDRDYEPMVMYSSDNPQLTKQYRYKFTTAGVWVFLGLTILMAIIVFILSPFEFNDYGDLLHRRNQSFDVCNLVVCGVSLLILILGVLTKNPKVILVFIILFAIDSFVNLLRLYSVLQFVYFLVQLILIYISNYYRVLISPQWYYSL